uniref:Lipoprotein-attachment site-containing protein n=1 Tax=Candidatus Kentrum sp. MB TaxID=2138164 RepID=A0A450XSQ0_9GAMM|nr:MAG: hypothetical protein BECKMB1821I_GA0114274_10324 [Candidatus Kentron sp. MB]VFK75830.1 MAG: hypothetical protein BECKMB1821H_GA0114242_10334 [Candidatus Kentron sp. MB]
METIPNRFKRFLLSPILSTLTSALAPLPLILVVGLQIGCGQKGPLYFSPETPTKAAGTATQAKGKTEAPKDKKKAKDEAKTSETSNDGK